MVHDATMLLTINEVCALLRVNRATLHRWEKSGLLVPVRLGGVIRYRRADIDALLDATPRDAA